MNGYTFRDTLPGRVATHCSLPLALALATVTNTPWEIYGPKGHLVADSETINKPDPRDVTRWSPA
jgi:hypothetical protein